MQSKTVTNKDLSYPSLMRVRSVGQTVAWTVLILLIPVAAYGALIVLGGYFTMSNADYAIPDNRAWFNSGPFSFLPALMLGMLSILVFRLPLLQYERGWGRYVVWLPIAWLVVGASRFVRVEFWGNGFTRNFAPALYVPLIPVPMAIAAICLWVVRIPRHVGTGAAEP